ncbi:general secretion pathway protein GspK [Acidovorax sp. SUPP1855]|uniref:general secretion pathway protein GspK n=1 Tax=Acidovorax sp. SUPP1855 TaxID=431774 RepID=UPI0023DE2200|nr:type II secretion system protein GspK [Acidovorax sp. SUPP1855]GKS84110.1 general secretion pathway protein GspK [Acidovorax sp. SUPP1855]
MALLAVLWMVAALTIIVSGLTKSVREEARMMTLSRQNVQAQALGDGAIQLALQAIVATNTQMNRTRQAQIAYRGVSMQVQAMPLNGLIDINGAPVALLARLIAVAGGVSPDLAQGLAQATVDMRERRNPQGVPQRFESEEDLLKVPGFDYPLYARLSPLITADVRGRGMVNPMAAPVEVLTVLAGGNAAVAMRIAAERESGAEGIDTTALEPAFLDNSTVRRVRIQARVPMPDGVWLRVSRSIDFNARAKDGVPWHTFRTSSSVEPVIR